MVDNEDGLQRLFFEQCIGTPLPEKTVAAIDLFQGFVPIVRLPETKDIQKQAAGSVPVETFQFRKVAGLKIRELPALREWILRSVGRMAHVGEEVQGTGARISEIPGKTPEEKIGKMVFRTKIEEHVIHSDRWITVRDHRKTGGRFFSTMSPICLPFRGLAARWWTIHARWYARKMDTWP